MELRILFEDAHFIAVDKPAGFHVHPPEDKTIRIDTSRTCLSILKRQFNCEIYPIHRLDYATAGVLLFSLSSEGAQKMNFKFQHHEVKKTYYCVARGWLEESETLMELPLGSDYDESKKMESKTRLSELRRIELAHAVGRYSTARYSLVEAEPITGRLHQIRRHLAHMAHPIVGDVRYGDRIHNRFFKENLGIDKLNLKSQKLEFIHPYTNQAINLRSKWTGKWHKIFDLFGICPQ